MRIHCHDGLAQVSVHPTARIHASAIVEDGATIGVHKDSEVCFDPIGAPHDPVFECCSVRTFVYPPFAGPLVTGLRSDQLTFAHVVGAVECIPVDADCVTGHHADRLAVGCEHTIGQFLYQLNGQLFIARML